MKAVVITGATSGIGFAVSDLLLQNGYAVIGVGRSSGNCEAALSKLKSKYPGGQLVFFCADLMQQQEVKAVAGEIRAHLEKQFGGELFALINNAGCVRSWYMTTQEGYEQQFALNHLAGFLLTHELMPCLKEPDARVIFTSSRSHKMMRVHWKDLMYQKRYRPLMAYKQSKLCNLLLAYRLNELGVRAYGVDPGLVRTDIGNKNTGGIVDLVWKLRKKSGIAPEISAQTYLMLCENEREELYFGSLRPRSYNRSQVTPQNARRLFELSSRLCGIELQGLVN